MIRLQESERKIFIFVGKVRELKKKIRLVQKLHREAKLNLKADYAPCH